MRYELVNNFMYSIQKVILFVFLNQELRYSSIVAVRNLLYFSASHGEKT